MTYFRPFAQTATLFAAFAVSAAPPTDAAAREAPAEAPEAAQDGPPAGQLVQVPQSATPTMPINEVRIGMKGYGLTVFHGTEIEPFPVEVVSVIHDSSPRRGTIWILCDDPRLDLSGPVQGMSGSPIFLWDEGEPQQLGEGGRLIGAFAFGYAMVKECLAGVQPIELMRGVGERGQGVDIDGDASASVGSPAAALQAMTRLQAMATASHKSPLSRFRLDAVTELFRKRVAATPTAAGAEHPQALPPGPMGAGGVQRMMLPMSVGSREVASVAAPLLEPLGLVPVAASIAGKPPAEIDPAAVRIQPGSVLSIPLAFGDMDLSAAGTVTDVLPDGTVLGFGHAMFGEGDVALPMATGYVHFVVPLLTTSFKQAGSLRLQGSITQDEQAAVAGLRGLETYDLAPMSVAVEMPGQPAEAYDYQLVNHPQMTPILSVIVALQSITAAQNLPAESTMRVAGDMTFSGGRTLPLNTTVAGGDVMGLFFEVMPPIMAMMNNPHESLNLESMNVRVTVEPVLKVGSIVNGRIDSAQVAPGETVRVSAQVQPYGRPAQTYSTEVRVPEGTPEGDYQLMVMDASTFAMMSQSNRPYLMSTTTVDDLAEALRHVMSIDRDALYAVLQLPQQGIAVGRSELPRLPSSKRAMIATPTSTLAVPFVETVEEKIETGMIVQGQLVFNVSVREKTPPAPQNGR